MEVRCKKEDGAYYVTVPLETMETIVYEGRLESILFCIGA